MRNGGRAPIDHKAQWIIDRRKIGGYLEMKVKVPKKYIMIVYPQGTSRNAVARYLDVFEITVDGEKKECIDPSFYPYGTDKKGDNKFCLLDVGKPGKYSLKLTLVKDKNPFLKDIYSYAIDEIAGI